MFTLAARTNKTSQSATKYFSKTINVDIATTFCIDFLGNKIKPFEPISIGQFTISKLDVRKLHYRAKRAECDFFERYPDAFTNSLAIERIRKSVKILDPIYLLQNFGRTEESIFLVDNYFLSVGAHIDNEHVSDFMAKYCMYALHTKNIFNLYNERTVETGRFANVFSWINKKRWAILLFKLPSKQQKFHLQKQ